MKTNQQTKHNCSHDQNCNMCMKGGFPMKKEILSFVTLFLIAITTLLAVLLINEKREVSLLETKTSSITKQVSETYQLPPIKTIKQVIKLPEPKLKGKLSVEQAIKNRRSRRNYADEPLLLSELSQLLWSGQGTTDEKGHRSAPSARGVYPYSLYVVVRNVEGLSPGLYLYDSKTHTLGDLGVANAGELLTSAKVQDNAQKAPVVIAMVASYAKAAEKFPDNAKKVTLLEGGHIGQNIYLQAEAMKLAMVVTAGFNPVKVGEVLGLDKNETVIYLIPVGHIVKEVKKDL